MSCSNAAIYEIAYSFACVQLATLMDVLMSFDFNSKWESVLVTSMLIGSTSCDHFVGHAKGKARQKMN